MTDEPTFGARFARTWAQLQAYLADFDPEELRKLEDCDLEQTLALLGVQPELGA